MRMANPIYVQLFFTGTFYFILGNIQPKYRSSYKMIQLAALCKVSYINKYSMDAVLKPIVNDLKKLVGYKTGTVLCYVCNVLCHS